MSAPSAYISGQSIAVDGSGLHGIEAVPNRPGSWAAFLPALLPALARADFNQCASSSSVARDAIQRAADPVVTGIAGTRPWRARPPDQRHHLFL